MVQVSLVLTVVLMAAAAIVAGVASWTGLSARADAVEASRASTQRWAELQTARAALISADHVAVREVSLLAGGRIRAASGGTDGTVAKYAPKYGEQVELARTLAASGDPFVAMNVMQQASDRLRAEVLPRLEQRQDAAERPKETAPVIPLLVVLLVTAGAAIVHGYRAFRARRVLNAALASAAIVLLFVMVPAVVSVLSGQRAARDVRAGPQPAAARLAEGRNAAFDARSIELESVAIMVTVVSVQTEWEAAAVRAEASLPEKSLDGYKMAHADLLVSLRTKFGAAIRDFVFTRADGTAGAFSRFDAVTSGALAREVQATDDGWLAALGHLRLIAWASPAAGLVAASLVLPLASRVPSTRCPTPKASTRTPRTVARLR